MEDSGWEQANRHFHRPLKTPVFAPPADSPGLLDYPTPNARHEEAGKALSVCRLQGVPCISGDRRGHDLRQHPRASRRQRRRQPRTASL